MTAPAKPHSSAPDPRPVSDALREAIRHRAEQIYIRSGKIPGHDLENWAKAEQEIRSESAAFEAPKAFIVVEVDGVEYVGEYEPGSAGGYRAGEFEPNDPIPVRFEGDKMFVKRRNGKELETIVVQIRNHSREKEEETGKRSGRGLQTPGRN